jgi:long-chain fatty acid transport protein
MRIRKALPLLGLAVLAPAIVFGYGSRIATQDAEATARGNAFSATADDPSAIYYNPAGLMQLDGFDAEYGLYGISIDENYKPLHGTDAHDSTAHEGIQAVPNLFLSYHPTKEPFSFGFGIYAPFGLKTEWPDDASFRTSGLYGSLEFISFTPTFALQLTRSLSIGVGVSANYEDAELREGLTSSPGDSFSFKGDGVSVGGDFGIMWKPTERQSVGFSYHSPVSGGLSGHTQEGLTTKERMASEAGNAEIAAGKKELAAGIAYINSLPYPENVKQGLIAKANAQYEAELEAAGVPASGSFPTEFPTLGAKTRLQFPQYAILGYSFRPTPAWNIEADVDWTDWDSLNTLVLKRSDGSTVSVPFNWTHSFLYELGATYDLSGYKLSAGYIYSESSVPSASFNPIVPDSARNIFSVGVGHSFHQLSVNLAYQLSIGLTNRTIDNDSAADGRYSFLSNAVSISLGYHF